MQYTMKLQSPWYHSDKERWSPLAGDFKSDVALMGAGISGIATLFALLTKTKKQVAVFEKNLVASGATGNNAGLVAAHIEKPASQLISEFGLSLTQQAFADLDNSWYELVRIHEIIGIPENLVSITDVALGFNSTQSLLRALHESQLHESFGRFKWEFLILDDPSIKQKISSDISVKIQFVPQADILKILKTKDKSYCAAAIRVPSQIASARMDSKKFCYSVLSYLQKHYSDRFMLFENTEISKIEIYESHVLLHHTSGKIHCDDIILCTNGYKNFVIEDISAKKKIQKLHQAITPREGYLAGFASEIPKSYVTAFLNDKLPTIPYWYLSCAVHPNLLKPIHR